MNIQPQAPSIGGVGALYLAFASAPNSFTQVPLLREDAKYNEKEKTGKDGTKYQHTVSFAVTGMETREWLELNAHQKFVLRITDNNKTTLAVGQPTEKQALRLATKYSTGKSYTSFNGWEFELKGETLRPSAVVAAPDSPQPPTAPPTGGGDVATIAATTSVALNTGGVTTITHNLPYQPLVQVFAQDGRAMIADVRRTTNSFSVHLLEGQGGTVIYR